MERFVRLLAITLLFAAAYCFGSALLEEWKVRAVLPLACGTGALILGLVCMWISWPEKLLTTSETAGEIRIQCLAWIFGILAMGMVLTASMSRNGHVWLVALPLCGLWATVSGVRAALYPRPEPSAIVPKPMRLGQMRLPETPSVDISAEAIAHWWMIVEEPKKVDGFTTIDMSTSHQQQEVA